ncbi:PTS system mannose/fructose/sorbose family transporter subunit IID [Holdemania massiliensis]|uniref:PTS system mannose/fructose/sorbose family transporter subunit IID n=1 Tax=Holdemania massiliensis TaxID=1468449 RepID=UPI001F068379|nr:PTS system mannose/fructose/sorbose family transporter subunit IID [Holdemania massiliensis]MCH1941937.1 PTS system mannose/fructose/sorbose family transporter subunit IID [Holdemania massiliensis]
MINDKMKALPGDERKMLNQMAIRTLALSTSQNSETMQGFAYVYAMTPAIKRFYPDKEKRIEAYKRHFTIFNTTPTCGGFVTGLTASMEKEAAKNPEFDTTSINAVKTALMGPIAGVGDSIFWGSVRTIATGIGLGFAATGNVLGPILMILIHNGICFFPRYYGPYFGYIYGTSAVSDLSESGLLRKITKYATIVGMMTVGAMTCTMVKLPLALSVNLGGAVFSLQALFDGIIPNLVPLTLVLGVMQCLRKGIKSTTIIYAMLLLGIIGKYLGVF